MIRILFVCLGNICRSPTAEGVLREMLRAETPALDVAVDSAATANYHVGEPPDLRSQHAARLRGIDLAGLRARQVHPGDFSEFDFILAMDRANLRDLEAMRPPHSRAKLKLFMEFAPQARSDEVPDPYEGGPAGFETVLDLTEGAASGLIAALRQRAHRSVS